MNINLLNIFHLSDYILCVTETSKTYWVLQFQCNSLFECSYQKVISVVLLSYLATVSVAKLPFIKIPITCTLPRSYQLRLRQLLFSR